MEVHQIRIQKQLMGMAFLQLANIMFQKEDINHLEQWVKATTL